MPEPGRGCDSTGSHRGPTLPDGAPSHRPSCLSRGSQPWLSHGLRPRPGDGGGIAGDRIDATQHIISELETRGYDCVVDGPGIARPDDPPLAVVSPSGPRPG